MKFTQYVILSALSLFLATACTEDLEMAPTFVLVEDFNLVTPNLEGSTSNITEVWAFADNQFVGAFSLPARIPVFSAGETEVRLQPGVRRNGVSTTPDPYEFYAPAVRTLDLIPGETVDLGTLTVGYRQDVQFGFIENFEPQSDRVFVNRIAGTQDLMAQSEVVRSGDASGRFVLTEDQPLFELSSNVNLKNLFAVRPYVWLEVDFRSEAPIGWGVIGRRNGGEVRPFDPTSSPRDEWTKIYFDMTQIVAASQLDEFEVYLTSILPAGEEDAVVHIDNIRLLYF
ncbi:hypothetical protein [Lewinella sp. 4G2]|uniref:hypothetical protein n=1 Tax=Lewinella sp. 4G2 TaxID=1803372 RepID=UPI0007B4B94C|nr:hypothetical protein [Lewinella sp. 4G2]OAV43837.1 hypothetical protein A3850_004680 [Lewinella sp. 4G2]